MNSPGDSKSARRAGVLLHPTSLPGPYGIGDMGAAAYTFVDWLAAAGMSLWQILPLVPADMGGSPYSSWSALGGNPDLIDVAALVELGLLHKNEAAPFDLPPHTVDYGQARARRRPLLLLGVRRLLEQGDSKLRLELDGFRAHAPWVEDMALYAAIKDAQQGKSWVEWPKPLRDRDARALAKVRTELAQDILAVVAQQFLFDKQWRALKQYANAKGIEIIGDIPIYVDADSVDVWVNRELFHLDDDGRPSFVAGVPPDAFSATGQHWGNPLYRWDRMASTGYAWWQQRLHRALELADHVRIDHFRGLASYWAIPRDAEDGRTGEWRPGPGLALLNAIKKVAPTLPIIAEDLGIIGDDVRQLLRDSGLPGMLVLQFAFGHGGCVGYLPHSHIANAVVYTGTHDNDTTRGWWETAPEHMRDHVRRYFGRDGHDAVWDLMRAALASVANTAVIPMQDVLQLGSTARMNTPSIIDGSWRWRMQSHELRLDLAERLRGLAALYGRVRS